MSKHTPGPWVTETNSWGETSVKSANESDLAEWPIEYFIAEKIGGHVRGDDFTDFSEVHANANLIAAAPDLLEALEQALNALAHCKADAGYNSMQNRAAQAASKAIARAKGESQ